MCHNSTIHHIRVSIIAHIALLPVIDRPLLSSVDIIFASIVGRDFHRVFHAVRVRRAVIGKIELIALAVIVVEGVGVFGFYFHVQSDTQTHTHPLTLSLSFG